jgi:16S rRNA G1207 methylase RsmC
LLIIDDDLGAQDKRGELARERLASVIGVHSGIRYCSAFDQFLGKFDYGVVGEAVRSDRPATILLDVGFGDQPYFGFELLDRLNAEFPEIPIVMFSALDRETNLDAALKQGAIDFLNKESFDNEFFWFTLLRYARSSPSEWVVGQHSELQQAAYFGAHLASEGISLLIQGEAGSGKDQLARYVLDIVAFRRGTDWVEKALVIRNVDHLEASEQLNVLQNVVDARNEGRLILATSNTPVVGLVRRGIFRRDLFEAISSYQSLGTSIVQLPPLRERKSDIPLVLRQFLLQLSIDNGVPAPKAVPSAMLNADILHTPSLTMSEIAKVASLWIEEEGDSDRIATRLSSAVASSPPQIVPDTKQQERAQVSDVDTFLRRVASHDEAYSVTVGAMNLLVLPGVFSPRYSHSSDFLIENMPDCKGARVLDMGCGTGVLGLAALALHGASHATFVDVNPVAVENVQLNLTQMALAHRGRAMVSDLFERIEGRFDLILSNPPFWNRKPHTMLERSCFDEDHRFLRALLHDASSYLTTGGRLALVMSSQSDLALLFRELGSGPWELEKVQLEPAFASQGKHHVRVVCVARRQA